MKTSLYCALVIMLGMSSICSAGLVYEVDEIGGDIVFSYSGSINLNSTLGKQADRTNFINRYDSSNTFFRIAALTGSPVDDYNVAFTSQPALTALGLSAITGGTISGHRVLFEQFSTVTDGQIWLPDNYVSGDSISGSLTFSATDFASNAMNVGSYTWAWANGTFSDFVTVNINAPNQIPEPSTLALLGFGLAGFGYRKIK